MITFPLRHVARIAALVHFGEEKGAIGPTLDAFGTIVLSSFRSEVNLSHPCLVRTRGSDELRVVIPHVV